MKVTTTAQTLKQIIIEKILWSERVGCYCQFHRIWYIIKYNQQTYIHYTANHTKSTIHYYWFLAASITPPSFRPQHQVISLSEYS